MVRVPPNVFSGFLGLVVDSCSSACSFLAITTVVSFEHLRRGPQGRRCPQQKKFLFTCLKVLARYAGYVSRKKSQHLLDCVGTLIQQHLHDYTDNTRNISRIKVSVYAI